MRQDRTKSEGDASDQTSDRKAAGFKYLSQDYAESHLGEIRNQIVSRYDPRREGREQAITRHGGLILDLQEIMPASISEIAETTGQSLSATRNHLRQLMQLNLVIKTAFEHHTLYCLNGRYNLQISHVLTEYYE